METSIVNAFRKINRIDFLLSDKKDLSELNEALPIGYGQTISQPMVVAFMLELLQPKQGEKILDIGAGSGWTTALLAYIVSQKGNPKSQIPNPNDQNSKSMVIAIEIIPELAVFGKNNVAKYNFIKKGIVQFICADASKGLPEQAPFDKILCSAAIHPVRDAASNGARHKELPIAWKKQLKIGGRIVAPIGSSIWLFEKLTENDFKSKEYPGFAFVPLVEKKQR